MAERFRSMETYSLARLSYPARKLQDLIMADRGARIGDSTVVSMKVHTYDPARPEEICVLQDADAGKVFYQRQTVKEVYHLDIFHEKGLVDHRQVAKAIREAIASYNAAYVLDNCLMLNRSIQEVKADMIDVQTGTGGGRITGSLNFGQKMSLRRAHENHVHVAAIIPPEHSACLFYIVTGVEMAIQKMGLEIRRNEKITNRSSPGPETGDMSAYSDYSDSFLRDRQAVRHSSPAIQLHQYNQDAVELMNEFDTVQDLADTLQNARNECSKNSMVRELIEKANGEQTLDKLTAMGITTMDKNKIKLTEYGKDLFAYMRTHMPEIEAYFNRTLRLLKASCRHAGKTKITASGQYTAGYSPNRLTTSSEGWLENLNMGGTVLNASRRTVTEQAERLIIKPEDISQSVKHKKRKVEICLVLDASASMAGQRIRASKFLARHLLLTTPDRVGVITFQEQRADVMVPLTRDYRQVDESLKQLRAYGSTPLAMGLRSCLNHLKEASARNALIVLITDGVATYSEFTRDPILDALGAAKEIKGSGYDFTCIGLRPHKNYLEQLAAYAGGNKYIVDELDKMELVRAVWSEYRERC